MAESRPPFNIQPHRKIHDRSSMKRYLEQDTAKTSPLSSSPSSSDITDTEDLRCDCPPGLPTNPRDYFTCRACANLQHTPCSSENRGTGEGEAPVQFECNRCQEAALERLIAKREEEAVRMKTLVEQKRVAARDFLMAALWRHYCILPNGNASQSLILLTETTYEEGKSVSVNPAPENWRDEVQDRVDDMIAAAAREDMNFGALSEYSAGDVNESMLTSLRETAVWLLNRGPYRGRRKELGVLAEILGLEEKGTLWNY